MDYVYHANLQETYSISYKTSLDWLYLCTFYYKASIFGPQDTASQSLKLSLNFKTLIINKSLFIVRISYVIK
jgi:hypothetical protein